MISWPFPPGDVVVGSPGNIEKVMVAGILFIIVGILAVAIWGSHDKSASASGENVSMTPQDARNAVPPPMRPNGKTGDDVEKPTNDGDAGFVVAADQDLENSSNVQPVENGKFDEVTIPRKNPEESPKQPEAPAEQPKVEPSKGPEIPDTYTVVGGDNFSKIAEKVYGNKKYAAEIQKANPSVQPTKLNVNQKLKLPKIDVSADKEASDTKAPPVVEQPDAKVPSTADKPTPKTHTIQVGDNLIDISRKYYNSISKVSEILKLNKDVIKDQNKLPVGKTIKLP